MTGYNLPGRDGNEIYKSVVEDVIRNTGRGVAMRLVGTGWGMSYDDIESAIRVNLREPRYGTSRCQRIRAWDLKKRLSELGTLRILEGNI